MARVRGLEPLGAVPLFHRVVSQMFVLSATTPTNTRTRQTSHHYEHLYQILSCKFNIEFESVLELFRNRHRKSHYYSNHTH